MCLNGYAGMRRVLTRLLKPSHLFGIGVAAKPQGTTRQEFSDHVPGALPGFRSILDMPA